MLKLSSICLATLLVLHTPFSVAETRPVSAMADSALAASIDAGIARYFKADEPGATVIVLKDGKPVFRKAYGMADVTKGVTMTPDMSLRLGSITKQFTAVAILMLVEEGKLAVSDDITKFFPDYPVKGKKISIEHLLTHTSGIVSYTGKPDFRAQSTKDVTVAQMIDYFKNDPLEFEPGTRYRYNNSAYFLLGAVIEKLSGMPYAKFVEQRIFVPLGMTQSAYEGYERTPTTRALGHTRNEKGFAAASQLSMSQPYAAGSLVSTVDDLARWDAAISQGKLLKAASWKQAFTAYKLADGKSTDYGYGWDIGTLQGAPSIAHGGGINGFSTFAIRLPEQKVYVAVLTNSESGITPASLVATKAAGAAIGKPFPDPTPVKLTASQLDTYSGSYKVDEKTTYVVRRDNDNLVMQRPGRRPLTLQPSSDGAFFENSINRFEFARGATGEVNQVTALSESAPLVYQRSGPAPKEAELAKISHADFDKWAGRYQLMPAMVLEISRDGDRYFGQATGQPKIEVFPLSDTLFLVKAIDGKIQFGKAADGKDQLVLTQGGRDLTAPRLP